MSDIDGTPNSAREKPAGKFGKRRE